MIPPGGPPPESPGPPPTDAPGSQPVIEIAPPRRSALLRTDFANKVALTFATEAVLFVLGIALAIATARWLGPSGKGEFALITTIVSLVYSFSSFGVSQAVVYFAKRLPESELVRNALSLSLVLGVLSMAVGGAIGYALSGSFDLNPSVVLVAVLGLPALHLDSTARGLIQGKYALTSFNILRLVNPVVFLPLLAGALIFPDRVNGAIVAWTLSQYISALFSVRALLRRREDHTGSWVPKWAHWKTIFLFGARTHLGNVLKFFQYRFDVVLIGALLDKRQVGFYAVGLSLAELPLRIPDAVGLVLFPKVAATAEDKRESITPLVSRHTVFMTIVSSALLFLFAPLIITVLFGSRFEPATVPARVLLPGGVALALWKILAQDMIARGRPNAYSASALCSLVTIVAGCLLLVPNIGLAGGALASSVAYTAAATSLFVAYRRATGATLRDCVLIWRSDLAIYWNALRRHG
ncbi:MAG: flippase [Actinomycetota bacterium]|nr:flippase [Actinomycetota bacterium]